MFIRGLTAITPQVPAARRHTLLPRLLPAHCPAHRPPPRPRPLGDPHQGGGQEAASYPEGCAAVCGEGRGGGGGGGRLLGGGIEGVNLKALCFQVVLIYS